MAVSKQVACLRDLSERVQEQLATYHYVILFYCNCSKHRCFRCVNFLQGELEEEFESEEDLSHQPSKISYKGAEGKIRRKGTITHIRESVRSTRSLGGRSGVLPRQKSIPDSPISPTTQNEHVQFKNKESEVEIELEAVTLHQNTQEIA